MSFTIRTVTARAGGGEILRSRTLDAQTATIGRGADCAIHLPDLAVQLHHATITITGRNTLAAQAIRDARFEYNGKNVTQATLTIVSKPALRFGSHVLAFAPGEQPDEVVVTISRSVGAGEPADASRLRRIFALQPNLFGKRSAAWILALGILIGCIVAPIGIFYWGWGAAKIHSDQQWLPGPLSAGHRFLLHNCQACHQQAFVSARDSACLACHKAGLDRLSKNRIAARVHGFGSWFAPVPAPDHASTIRQLRARIDPANAMQQIDFMFGNIFGHPAMRCAECHAEHVGRAGQVAIRHKPSRPTVAQLRNFDCISCHRRIRDRLTDSIVADTPSWDRHPEFRPVVFVSPQGRRARTILAGVAQENRGLKFSHWQHLYDPAVIDEAVKLAPARYGAKLACKDCHTPSPDGRSFLPIERTQACSACHDLTYAVAANGEPLVLKHGDPDRVVRQLRAAFAAARPLFTTRRRPGYVGDPYRDPISGTRRLSPEQVNAAIRSVFQKGGLCYGCHTFVQPYGPQSLVYRVPALERTYRNLGASQYFPWSAFDHGILQHSQDAQRRPTCRNCHRVIGSKEVSYMTLPPVRECRSCHGATHATTPTPASSDCMDCHGYHVPDRPLSAPFDNLHGVLRTTVTPADLGMREHAHS